MPREAVTEGELTAIVFVVESRAVGLVLLEDLLKLCRRRPIENEAVDLVVIKKTTSVEIRASNGAETTVDHHHFGMMEPRLIVADLSTALR